MSELASTMTVGEIASQAAEAIMALRQLASDDAELTDPAEVGGVIADLQRMVENLPQVCEQLARFLVASHEDRQIAGDDLDVSVEVSAEALSAAGQAADMLAAALAEARVASQGLRPVR